MGSKSLGNRGVSSIKFPQRRDKTKSVFPSASEGLFVIEIQMPAFLLQQQKRTKNSAIRVIRAKR